ncbi:putative pentatricopeptide repeat-containing protein [Vitis vinifera]|uniref:Putative pentatricopeptide repeat-containing protein n=1 Tax=Vitis vinifera TaxID=29760 RepID=A0A438JEW3_VITVI|nr:putative pentatricopeptide repeat-containing protein [Vitis vinifera]
MCSSDVLPDDFTLSTLSKVSSELGALFSGKSIHGKSIRTGFVSDTVVANSIMSMYCKCGNFDESRKVFDEMTIRNSGSWNVLIAGYAVSGNCNFREETWEFVKQMQMDEVRPDAYTISSLLPLCDGDMGKWDYGRSSTVILMKCRNVFSWTAMINGYVENGDSDEALSLFRDMQELNNEVSLCNALIDMYSKCGSLDSARRVFEDDSLCKDAISWSSMISGYGLHGKGQEAILLYDKMLQAGIRPDMITTVGILSACGRSGLVNEGLNIYSSVINDYGIEPTLEICACIVDMLGRAGQLDRALDFIKAIPVEPGPSVWGALVSCSIIHGDLEMQELAYRFLIQLEPKNPSNYVSISNLYASSRRWDAVAEVRRMMKDKRLRKVPGCSWISINNKTHCFYVADKAHPSSTSIYNMLDDLLLTMNDAICSPHLETST